jgi:pimeloyl-ACP methyl ester carboxylesterase
VNGIEERVRICGLDVHVSVRPAPGDAPPLLHLMGIGGNTEMWQPLRSILGAGRTTIAFDVPGTGRSSAPPVPLPLIGLIAIRVLDHAGVERADLLGVSWGGLLAQQIAIAHRKRVRRVVLANTHFGVASVPRCKVAVHLLLAGVDDPAVPAINARIMAKLLPDAELHVVRGGHLMLFDRAADIAPVIEHFLDQDHSPNAHQAVPAPARGTR